MGVGIKVYTFFLVFINLVCTSLLEKLNNMSNHSIIFRINPIQGKKFFIHSHIMAFLTKGNSMEATHVGTQYAHMKIV